MFKKLKNKFITQEIDIQECTISYDDKHFYYNVNHHGLEEFYAVIPERFRTDFSIKYFTAFNGLRPHHDNGANTAINFYFKANGAIGTFYNVISEDAVLEKVGKTGAAYKPEALEIFGTYVAEDHDAYVLDITKPHSVTFSKDPRFEKSRSALALQTSKFSFAEVCTMLVETGNL